jgi:hypothetical protein
MNSITIGEFGKWYDVRWDRGTSRVMITTSVDESVANKGVPISWRNEMPYVFPIVWKNFWPGRWIEINVDGSSSSRDPIDGIVLTGASTADRNWKSGTVTWNEDILTILVAHDWGPLLSTCMILGRGLDGLPAGIVVLLSSDSFSVRNPIARPLVAAIGNV